MDKKLKTKCEHLEGEISFGKILIIDTEMVEVAYKEKCQNCGKVIERNSFIYRRRD